MKKLQVGVLFAVVVNFLTMLGTIAVVFTTIYLFAPEMLPATVGVFGEAVIPWVEDGEVHYDPTRVEISTVEKMETLEHVRVMELEDGTLVLMCLKDGLFYTEVVRPQ